MNFGRPCAPVPDTRSGLRPSPTDAGCLKHQDVAAARLVRVDGLGTVRAAQPPAWRAFHRLRSRLLDISESITRLLPWPFCPLDATPVCENSCARCENRRRRMQSEPRHGQDEGCAWQIESSRPQFISNYPPVKIGHYMRARRNHCMGARCFAGRIVGHPNTRSRLDGRIAVTQRCGAVPPGKREHLAFCVRGALHSYAAASPWVKTPRCDSASLAFGTATSVRSDCRLRTTGSPSLSVSSPAMVATSTLWMRTEPPSRRKAYSALSVKT